MAQYGTGLKAGALAGLVSGVLTALITALLLEREEPQIVQSIQASLPSNFSVSATQLFTYALYADIGTSIVAGVVGGLIIGLIFAFAYDRFLRTARAEYKGLIFGVVLWLIDLALSSGNSSLGAAYFGAYLGSSLVANLIFGYLLGYFYRRFERRTTAVQEPGYPSAAFSPPGPPPPPPPPA